MMSAAPHGFCGLVHISEMVFPLYGVRFISINDEFDSDKLHGDTGGINVAFKYLISEFYSRDLSIKQKSSYAVRFRRGEHQSKRCPYGYQKGANGRLEPDEETAPNVRLIFELAQDGYTPTKITKELFACGIPTPGEYRMEHGEKMRSISQHRGIWTSNTVTKILQDERYTGTYIGGKHETIAVGGHRVRIKDESEWVKIPDHHPAIIGKELFAKVQAQLPCKKIAKANRKVYPLRGKVYCGCCRHAMVRVVKKSPAFSCRYTRMDEASACHRLVIGEAELETMLYEILSKQAQVILNLGDLSHAEPMSLQIAKQSECGKQVERCLEQKQELYERFLLKEIPLEDYKTQNAAVDAELNRLKQLQSALTAQVTQMQMDEKVKSARTKLAQEIASTSGLTAGLADALIDRVYIYPGNQIEIAWKMDNFCTE